MNRQEIISQLKEFFTIDELVCNHTFNAYGERSWQFLNTEYLHSLLIIRRDILQTGMFCNNYPNGRFMQRGLRCNMCELVHSKNSLYLSAHVTGSAGDFDVKGIPAVKARSIIEANQHLLPYPIRMEEGVTWLHFDVYNNLSGKQINYFTA